MTNKSGTRPFVLSVRFPLMDAPREMTQTEVNRLLNYLRTISNDDYEFQFQFPDFMSVKIK